MIIGWDHAVKLNKASETIDMRSEEYTSFAIVALRCNSDESTGKRKLRPNDIYYLLDGYDFKQHQCNSEECRISQYRYNLNAIFNEYLNQTDEGQPHVIISAIVGQNGSGKSSLIEFMMRLINNFAAKTFGEAKHGDASDRLHFIDGVDGDLWYVIDNQMYQLHIKNTKVALYALPTHNCVSRQPIIFDDGREDVVRYENILPRMGKEDLYRLFGHFFYTIVSNYSIYAYNTNDFIGEWDSNEKERLISARYPNQEFSNEERCWIHGLFHKNDGYQTPIVITPFRHEGEIHINSENSLSRERLISLLINHEDFRRINGHLIADSIHYTPYDEREKDYTIKGVRKYLGFKNLKGKAYRDISDQIIKLWSVITTSDLALRADPDLNKPFQKEALDYLVYKTLKIAKTYSQHHHDYDLLAETTDTYNPQLLIDIVKSISKDFSHITRKIYQTIAYIVSDIYSSLPEASLFTSAIVSLKDIKRRHKRWIDNGNPSISGPMHNLKKDFLKQQALIPPPFMKSRILLHEDPSKETRIDFESLSSGEKQQIYAISSILYHLDNLDSVAKDKSDPYRIQYRNVFVVLEEIELYFHPELQQGFIKFLLDGIRRIPLHNIRGIHILMVTHSPYVLSDIPRNNVLALKSNGSIATGSLNTFCGNIHEMLKDSFFLSKGSQGFFAKWEIGFLMGCLNIHKAYRKTHKKDDEQETDHLTSDGNEEWNQFLKEISEDSTSIYDFTKKYMTDRSDSVTFKYQQFDRDYPEQLIQERIEIIDEPLIRSILQREFNMTFMKTEEEILRLEIEQREQKLKKLIDGRKK